MVVRRRRPWLSSTVDIGDIDDVDDIQDDGDEDDDDDDTHDDEEIRIAALQLSIAAAVLARLLFGSSARPAAATPAWRRAPLNMADEFEVDLAHRVTKWREEHPKRNYAGCALSEARRGLPAKPEKEIAGRAALKPVEASHLLGGAEDADGDDWVLVAASGAADPAGPTSVASLSEDACAEVVGVPLSQGLTGWTTPTGWTRAKDGPSSSSQLTRQERADRYWAQVEAVRRDPWAKTPSTPGSEAEDVWGRTKACLTTSAYASDGADGDDAVPVAASGAAEPPWPLGLRTG